MRGTFARTASGLAIAVVLTVGVGHAQDRGPSYTTFGTPGLLEMPTAESAPRSDIAATLSYSESGGYKTTFTYQLTDRLSGSFRYSVFDIYREDINDGSFETFDRSFDIQYRLTDETTYFPAIAVGLRDFLGTGRFSSEYIVASKSFGPNLIVTGGIGWGAMGTNNSFDNPLSVFGEEFNDRPVYDDRIGGVGDGDTGGQLSTNQWFRGPAAAFAGIEYQVTPKLGFKAEYSSNEYTPRTYNPAVDYQSPFNYGVTWRPRPGVEIGASYLYGSDFGVQATFFVNPEVRPTASGLDPAPAPVRVRTADQRAAQTWDRAAQPEPAVRAGLTELLKVEGARLLALEITDTTARVRYENTRFRSQAQAAGRVARMMSQIIPPSVNTFILEPVERGIPVSAIRINRTALEAFENRVGATEAMLEQVSFGAAGGRDGLVFNIDDRPRFEWGIAPYLTLVLFDQSGPINQDVGLNFDAKYRISEGLVASGRASVSLLGEQEPLSFFDNPNDYANVRTDVAYFGRDGGVRLEHLTLAHYGRVAPEIYSRVTAGYLEKMYGGVSGELLWKPVNSRFALGAELNYSIMRDQDMGFTFAEYETQEDGSRVEVGDYEVVTGHLSAYYDFGNGYHGQVDVGRYLAGDWGATVALDREFGNGWRVGGYFTLTDMPFDQFGEGSFDKGIRVSIPFDYFIGTPSQRRVTNTLRSLTRDGGARLNVDGRLYDVVRDGHEADMTDTWGRFWR